MLPLDIRDIKNNHSSLMDSKFPQYIRRLCDFKQMDFEITFDQMLNLLSIEPQKAFTSFYYRKQTKNQWARDDPAFIVIESLFVIIASLSFAIAFKSSSVWSYVWITVYTLFVDYLFLGFIIASTTSYLANRYLLQMSHSHSVEQRVEWMYAFDIHANAFFCSFFLSYVIQYFLLPVVLGHSVVSCLISNILYSLSTLWYFYITYIGYKTLPFISNPQVFLWYPILVIGFLFIFSIMLMLLGIKANLSRIIMSFHYG